MSVSGGGGGAPGDAEDGEDDEDELGEVNSATQRRLAGGSGSGSGSGGLLAQQRRCTRRELEVSRRFYDLEKYVMNSGVSFTLLFEVRELYSPCHVTHLSIFLSFSAFFFICPCVCPCVWFLPTGSPPSVRRSDSACALRSPHHHRKCQSGYRKGKWVTGRPADWVTGFVDVHLHVRIRGDSSRRLKTNRTAMR